MDYYHKYQRYKQLYRNLTQCGGVKTCTQHTTNIRKCLDQHEFQEKGKSYRCSYRKGEKREGCYKIPSERAETQHQKVRQRFPQVFHQVETPLHRIEITGAGGDSFTIEAGSSTTIKEIKLEIEKVKGLLPQHQQLFLPDSDQPLKPDHTLSMSDTNLIMMLVEFPPIPDSYHLSEFVFEWSKSLKGIDNDYPDIEKTYGKMEDWDTSKVTDMVGLFSGWTHSRKRSILNYSNIEDRDTLRGYMSGNDDEEYVERRLDEYIEYEEKTHIESWFMNLDIPDISGWDTSKVKDMSAMFRGSKTFNQPIGKWDTSQVTTMSYMFEDAKLFDQNINDWDVSQVKNMWSMFSGASQFNHSLNKWDTSQVTKMSYMFENAKLFDQNINDWDVSQVKDMSYMFSGASQFNQPLNKWETSQVTKMSSMFRKAVSFDQDISGWDLNKLKSKYGDPFSNCPIQPSYRPGVFR